MQQSWWFKSVSNFTPAWHIQSKISLEIDPFGAQVTYSSWIKITSATKTQDKSKLQDNQSINKPIGDPDNGHIGNVQWNNCGYYP